MSEPAGTSRRTILASAGGVGAAGLGGATAAGSSGGGVARGRPGQSVVEFRGRISQSGPAGETFTSNGFLTAVAGLERRRPVRGQPARRRHGTVHGARHGRALGTRARPVRALARHRRADERLPPVRPGSRLAGSRVLHQRSPGGPVRPDPAGRPRRVRPRSRACPRSPARCGRRSRGGSAGESTSAGRTRCCGCSRPASAPSSTRSPSTPTSRSRATGPCRDGRGRRRRRRRRRQGPRRDDGRRAVAQPVLGALHRGALRRRAAPGRRGRPREQGVGLRPSRLLLGRGAAPARPGPAARARRRPGRVRRRLGRRVGRPVAGTRAARRRLRCRVRSRRDLRGAARPPRRRRPARSRTAHRGRRDAERRPRRCCRCATRSGDRPGASAPPARRALSRSGRGWSCCAAVPRTSCSPVGSTRWSATPRSAPSSSSTS